MIAVDKILKIIFGDKSKRDLKVFQAICRQSKIV